MTRWAPLVLAAAMLLVLACLPWPATIRALQIGFVAAGAAPVGAVLLLAIARLTGADWSPITPVATSAPVLVPVALLAMLAGGGVALPDHLSLWQAPWFAALRAGIVTAALAWAAWRLAAGASLAFAGATLALYAWLVTPIASDWLLATEPGHAVSAIGMMLFVEQIGAACAVMLVLGTGGERFQQDMAKLLVAASLGLCYLPFMDYLIVWFGNLPSRVPFYVARGTPGQTLLVTLALLLGLAGPIAALSLLGRERGRRLAGASALAGYFLFDLWWIGASIGSALLALLAGGALAVLLLRTPRRAVAHG